MNFLTALALRLPAIINGAIQVQSAIRKPGVAKKTAVIAQIPEMIKLADLVGAGKFNLNDPAIMQLVSVYIDAEAAALKAKNALREGILVHVPAPAAIPGGW